MATELTGTMRRKRSKMTGPAEMSRHLLVATKKKRPSTRRVCFQAAFIYTRRAY